MIIDTDDMRFGQAVRLYSTVLVLAGVIVGLFGGWIIWG